MGVRDISAWQAVRIFASCALAYAVSAACGLKEGYWAVITAIVVTQPALDDTIQASRTRITGTLIGAAIGFLVLEAVQRGLPRQALFWGALAPLAALTSISQSLRLSCITLTVVVLVPSAEPSFARPLDRVYGILIGAGASVVASALASALKLRRAPHSPAKSRIPQQNA